LEALELQTEVLPPLLSVEALGAGYGNKQVIHDVSLSVRQGEIVGLFGHNGAGKTTTIRSVLGLVPTSSGKIVFAGKDITYASPRTRVKAGIAMIPSERFVFPDMSIRANLLLGAANSPKASDREERLSLVEDLFPLLAERSGQRAGALSGGQQRMVSLGIALMARPRLLLLDEPSLGLAPSVVEQIFGTLRTLVDTGELGILLLEQNVKQALLISDRVDVMRSGSIIVQETADEMRARESYWDLF
jgi:branched-chain amino acid transport system ATP-binding protein